jgi:threonine synthase
MCCLYQGIRTIVLPGTLTHLECSACHKTVDPDQPQSLCPACQSPLLARYDLARVREAVTPAEIGQRPPGIWRWRELLPVRDPRYELSLGEGETPLIHVPRLGARLGLDSLYIKDESLNPTGSFKARGMVVAIARARELGVQAVVVPTAGNAGGAMAAYAAYAGLEAHVYMPRDAPPLNQIEVQLHGAQLILVDGLIDDAARLAAAEASKQGWFDMTTLKEPYRIEGKKTMGFELALHFAEGGRWQLPDVVFYPTGGGVGLIGMWKAFDEMESLGWIDNRRPRFVSVQAEGCAPIVRAYQEGAEASSVWQNAHTIASGLRVPAVRGDRLILRALRETGGVAIAVSDDDILDAQWLVARLAGIFSAPEGAATYAALVKLVEAGWIKPHERVVLYNTGTGMKYTHVLPPPTG